MRIEQSTVALSSSRQASTTDSTRGTLQAWVGDRPASAAGARAISSTGGGAAAIVRISAEALATALASAQAAQRVAASRPIAASGRLPALASQTASASSTLGESSDPTISDPNLSVLVLLIERLTGRKIHLIRPGDIEANADAKAAAAGREVAQAVAPDQGQSARPAPQTAGWGVALHVEQIHRETETTAYSAAGTVQTSDGRTVSFEFTVAMHRDETRTATLDVLAGDATRKVDPIALNLNSGAVSLASTRSGFDIDSDGAVEQIALPAAGTYFLALDRDGNGAIESGTELFGPTTGDGFAEMRALDEDGNGWIDEGDRAFTDLRLWSGPDAAALSLGDMGVGGLYVGSNVATQFEVNGAAAESLGQVVSSSVYLAENGTPGAMQQVDLTV